MREWVISQGDDMKTTLITVPATPHLPAGWTLGAHVSWGSMSGWYVLGCPTDRDVVMLDTPDDDDISAEMLVEYFEESLTAE